MAALNETERSVTEPNTSLRLYVIGESSGNPDDWSEFGGWSLVLAKSAEDALSFDDLATRAAEVFTDKSGVLARFPLTFPAD